MSRSYKEYDKVYIGSSDMAELVFRGCGGNHPYSALAHVRFGEDGSYYAYVVDENAEIGDHYELAYTCHTWLMIYDDEERTFNRRADRFDVYRAGERGCIIRMIGAQKA